jgi:hypothetical protein
MRPSLGCDRANHSTPSTNPVFDITVNDARRHHVPTTTELMAMWW